MKLTPHALTARTHIAIAAFLALFASIVAAGLSASIYSHRSEVTAEYKNRFGGDRWDKTIRRWLDRGFAHEGGMQFWDLDFVKASYPKSLPSNESLPADTVFPWKNSTMSWIIPAFWLQKINQTLGRDYSVRLTLLYNKLAIAFAAVAIGYLCALTAMGLGQRLGQALAIGAGSQLVFQTFPLSLLSYWEVQPLALLIGFAALFLSHEYRIGTEAALPFRRAVLRCFLATMVIFCEPVTGGAFLCTYLVVRAVMDDDATSPRHWMVVLIIPAILVVCYLMWQQVMVRSNYDSVLFVGSSVTFRTGLDGDTTFYRDQLDLVFDTLALLKSHWLLAFLDWHYLNYFGLIATATAIAYYRTVPALQLPSRLLLASYGLYLPAAILFSQTVFIHPYYWNLALLVPFIIATFCIAPAVLNFDNRLKGISVLASSALALFYAAYHARLFAVAFPARG